ncbi:anaerobic C4-dicarboxylate transporter, DcuA/DcuB family [Campylobacter pinnipediorum subsp. caledonicus]|uniref:C4-dicarboxylate transporter DcuA n=1 Tax=Campylobacter pinnipediorum subsp. caledonicus TaxID=1874362 RepID=A0A1S6U8A0_9BACT|nr:anaerobic C4-dicarboxylate transporter [Campylobacter pinnipediorum]AQW86328.1 anaerobic C4-dicarboxylate transporter, DcuA/DcuB family [Campylobacter pinnipediorum subsp. caledonicus]AQW87981.1 anaerobic C4-dicarboxylate transporter, DcuA/DcuB family [Campylobacter pinnipediorum subsp. caledonicus]OPA71426.1 C4-dicarboxylate ABC transporter [Campylobacter pinnipediorum subsp. caledonicus]
MDIMLILQIIVLFGGIYLGVKLGGMGIGYAGGLGVIVLTIGLGMKPANLPWDVILIIASVISAITAMQVAGGLDYMVQIAEKFLRKNPKYINYLAPIVTYLLTVFAGTGHTAFSILPVITEVAKGQNIKPSAPLALSVVSSQVAITASPISAAFVAMTGVCEPLGVSYPILLLICISTTFGACLITSFIVNKFYDLDLSKDPIYQERLKKGLIKELKGQEHKELLPYAKRSVAIFGIGVLAVVIYALAISNSIKLIDPVILGRDGAIMSFMLTIGAFIVIFCKVDTSKLLSTSTFQSGMNACICVLGIAWLGSTFVAGHIDSIKEIASEVVTKYPYILAIALYFVSCLLYSQAATTKIMMPAVAIAMGMTTPENSGQIWILVASFAAVSGLFVLPTYPTTLGAIAMDDTGTTKVGKFIINHSFFIPGTIMVTISVMLGFIVAPILI